jgi:hypothetical protein
MHALIWHYPSGFTDATKKLPLSSLGSHPVDVFASLEVIAKLVQLVGVLFFLGFSGCSAIWNSWLQTPPWCWLILLLCVAFGQTLNLAMYQAIGDAGVYYGFKLGRQVPWASGFPFNIGLRHPQYVGVVLTLLGGLTVTLCREVAELGWAQLVVVWAGMYAIMSAMEQAGDNDKAE